MAGGRGKRSGSPGPAVVCLNILYYNVLNDSEMGSQATFEYSKGSRGALWDRVREDCKRDRRFD